MKVLIADDEVQLVSALSAILTHNNITVDKAYNGEEALSLLDMWTYDCVILDIMMPKINGYEVLKTMRAKNDKTPVLFLSAKSEVDDRVMGLNMGADDYLPKPFSAQELLARIRSLVRRNHQQGNNDLKYGNLSLDLSTYEMKVGDKKEKLTNKQFQLMELFMMNPEKVFSSDELLNKITNYEETPDVGTIWVMLSTIRKKMASLESDVSIQLNRGLGYSLTKNV